MQFLHTHSVYEYPIGGQRLVERVRGGGGGYWGVDNGNFRVEDRI